MSADKKTDAPVETRPTRTFEPRPAPAEPQRPAAFPNDPNPPAPPQSRPAKDSDAGFGSFG